ncbi:MAG: hypothetical protein ACK5PF_07235 [bacterium]
MQLTGRHPDALCRLLGADVCLTLRRHRTPGCAALLAYPAARSGSSLMS